jgi:sugar-specific transcriptional regulator TrmB
MSVVHPLQVGKSLNAKRKINDIMQKEDFSAQTLEKLGLSKPQTRVYLAIVTVQKANVAKIANLSKVARPDVYRILSNLEENGLVKKIIGSPTKFEATPLKRACEMLLENKKHEYLEIQHKTHNLINNFNLNSHLYSADIGSFQIISSVKLLREMLGDENTNAKTSIDLITKWCNIRPVVFGVHQFFPDAIKRGVRIRLIVDYDPTDKRLASALRNPLLEIRYLGERVPIKATIYDKRKAGMSVGFSYDDIVPSLWSDNPVFLKMMGTYFDTLWQKAITLPVEFQEQISRMAS